MPKDTRVSQLQTKQLVITGSDGLIIYPVDKQSAANPNQGIIDQNKFPTGSIGQDVLFYVSGAVGAKDGSVRLISAFGGDLHISGNLTVDGTTIINDTMNFIYSDENGVMKQSGSLHVSGTFTADQGFSGSLTTLTDGTPYIIGGENITVVTNSNGSITFAASPGFFFSNTTGLAETSGSIEVSGSGLFKSGLTGALNVLPDGSPYLVGAASNVIFSTGSNGQITLSVATGSVGSPGGLGELAFNDGANVLTASNNLWVDDGVSLNVSGVVKASGGFTGSLTTLGDGSPYIEAIGGVSIITQSNGSLQISGTQGISEHGALSGLNNDDHTQYILVDGTRAFSGDQSFGGNNVTNLGDLKATSLTGSLTEVSAGTPFITVIGGLSIVTQSNGSLQLSGTQGISDHGALAGLGDDDHTQYALVDGTRDFTGIVTAPGFSGSLTKLSNGDDYLRSGTAITLTTGSDGSITIGATPGATLAAGSTNEIQYNLAGALTASTDFWVDPGVKLYVTGAVEASTGFTGSLTKTVAGTDFLVGSDGIGITVGAAGQTTIDATALSSSVAADINQVDNRLTTVSGQVADDVNRLESDIASAGFGLWYSITNDLTEHSASIAVSGAITAKSGITGALNTLPDGANFLVASDGLSTSTGSNGQIVVSGNPLSSSIESHVNDSTIHFTEASIDHTNIQNVGTNTHAQIDAHIANSTIHFTEASIDHGSISGLGDDDHTQYLRADGTRALAGDMDLGGNDLTNGGVISAEFTGSLTRTSAGTNFIVSAGSGVTISTGSAGQVTIDASTLSGSIASDINDLEAAQAGAAAWYEINAAEVVTTSSVGTTGSLTVKSGISGALNKLPDGTDFLRGVQPIFTTTGSSGWVSIAYNTNSSLALSGSGLFKSGLTGALNKLPNGSNYLVGTNGITTATGSSGQITVSFNEANFFPTNRTVSATQLSLADTDNNQTIYFTNSSDIFVTASAALTDDFEVSLVQTDAGRIHVSSSLPINKLNGFTTASAGAGAIIGIQKKNSEFYLNGALEISSSISEASSIEFNSYLQITSSNIQDAIEELSNDNIVVDSSGNRFLSIADNRAVIEMSNASSNVVEVPPGLPKGFSCIVVQTNTAQVQVKASGGLNYNSAFVSASAGQWSPIWIYSGSNHVLLAGDLELA